MSVIRSGKKQSSITTPTANMSADECGLPVIPCAPMRSGGMYAGVPPISVVVLIVLPLEAMLSSLSSSKSQRTASFWSVSRMFSSLMSL